MAPKGGDEQEAGHAFRGRETGGSDHGSISALGTLKRLRHHSASGDDFIEVSTYGIVQVYQIVAPLSVFPT